MAWLVTKFAVTALLVVLVSEVARRSTVLGAVIASVPLTSVLAMVWIWIETRDAARLAAFSTDVAWLVLPSLVLFVVFPVLVRLGVGFWWALAAGIGATAAAYLGALQLVAWLRG
jgi:hypothetical protein